MKFRSVHTPSPEVSFRDALFSGLASDGGLFVPCSIPLLDAAFLDSASLQDIAVGVLSMYIDEISRTTLERIVGSSLNFPLTLSALERNLYLLELFHGPTLAFKDFGARFMAACMSHFLQEEKRHLAILVATSGDTGSAVAHGFFGLPHVSVLILYPSGKTSPLQELQMTTLGGNITACEVEGTFDDCQRLVKQALNDRELQEQISLSTANSINVGRLLPQISYYVWAAAQLSKSGQTAEPWIVVPSGNFGNLTAAVYAKQMGCRMGKLVAATNVNDVASEFVARGSFIPHPSIQTYSNAMDVGNPSNLARLQFLYGNDLSRLRSEIKVHSVNDGETVDEIKRVHTRTGRVIDPHTAVGIAAARRVAGTLPESTPVVIAATAHPAKFQSIVEKAVGREIPLPEALKSALHKKKHSVTMGASYKMFVEILLGNRS